jgi:hypothetical protein
MLYRAHHLFAFMLALAVSGCSSDTPGPVDWSKIPTGPPARYEAGTETILVEQSIDATGGTLTGPAGSPVADVTVSFPKGALRAATALKLGHDSGTLRDVQYGTWRGPALVISSSGQTYFERPVTITLPNVNPSAPPLLFYIDASGYLQATTPLKVDKAARTASFLTWHASKFGAVEPPPDDKDSYQTGFFPEKDGFAVPNAEKNHFALGRCLGISAFAAWHFTTQGGGLFPKYMTTVPTKVKNGQPMLGQDVIASRAHSSTIRERELWALATNTGGEDSGNEDQLRYIKSAMKNSKSPAMISLDASASGTEPHAIAAFAYDLDFIYVYDPNTPGVKGVINFLNSSMLAPYNGYSTFRFFGGGALFTAEPFSLILKDADDGFHTENEVKLEITSHTSGDEVPAREVTLKGTAKSGQHEVAFVDVVVGGKEPVTATVDPQTSEFSADILLGAGKNLIGFVTRGYIKDPKNPVPIPHSMEEEDPFTLKTKNVPGSTITITATTTKSSPTSRSEATVSYSANLSFQSFDIATALKSGQFDFSKCTDVEMGCKIVSAVTMDRWPDFLSEDPATPLPVTVEYHFKRFRIDNEGKEHLSGTGDGQGTLSCNGLYLSIGVEPGSTGGAYRYLASVKPTGGCAPGAMTPMLTGMYEVGEDKLAPITPEALTLYTGFPGSLMVSAASAACRTPASVLPGQIEPWQAKPTGPLMLNLKASTNCTEGDTTTKEEATATVTLMPQ